MKQVSRQRLWQLANPLKHKAQRMAFLAARSGRITRPTHCQKCGKECTPHSHHDDYSKPLDVRWLCAKCHGAEHRGRRKLEAAKCSVCGKPAHARGWCRLHYTRWRTHGDPNTVRTVPVCLCGRKNHARGWCKKCAYLHDEQTKKNAKEWARRYWQKKKKQNASAIMD